MGNLTIQFSFFSPKLCTHFLCRFLFSGSNSPAPVVNRCLPLPASLLNNSFPHAFSDSSSHSPVLWLPGTLDQSIGLEKHNFCRETSHISSFTTPCNIFQILPTLLKKMKALSYSKGISRPFGFNWVLLTLQFCFILCQPVCNKNQGAISVLNFICHMWFHLLTKSQISLSSFCSPQVVYYSP